MENKYYAVLGLMLTTIVFWLIVLGIWMVEKTYPVRYLFPPGDEAKVRPWSLAGIIFFIFMIFAFAADIFVVLLVGTHTHALAKKKSHSKKIKTAGEEWTSGPAAGDEPVGDIGDPTETQQLVLNTETDEVMTVEDAAAAEVKRTNESRKKEVAITVVAGIVIMVSAVFILALYSTILANCGKYEFCCSTCGTRRVTPPGTGDDEGSDTDEAAGGCSSIRPDFLAQYVLMLIALVLSFVVTIWSIAVAYEHPDEEHKE